MTQPTDSMQFFAKSGLIDEIVEKVSRHTLPDPCKWSQAADGVFVTTCGRAFDFSDGGPDESGFSYCPFCGRSIVVKDGSGE